MDFLVLWLSLDPVLNSTALFRIFTKELNEA
jgi:hypothetical protein